MYIYVSGVQKNKRRGKLKMAADAAESLLKECKSIIEKYQAKSNKLIHKHLKLILLYGLII